MRASPVPHYLPAGWWEWTTREHGWYAARTVPPFAPQPRDTTLLTAEGRSEPAVRQRAWKLAVAEAAL